MTPARNTETTLDAELKSLLASATKDADGHIVATPYELTFEAVTSNEQDISQIVADAKPYGEAGAVAEVDVQSAARQVAQSLLLVVSKFDFSGRKAGTNTKAIPAGTDWLRKDKKTQGAVESFYSEIIPLVPVMKWQLATGNPASEFPFRKSVEYHFGILRRQVLPVEVLDAYGLKSDSVSGRVTANRADLNVAAKAAQKVLDGVKVFPKTFDDTSSAIKLLNDIIAQCETLAATAKESMQAAMAAQNVPQAS